MLARFRNRKKPWNKTAQVVFVATIIIVVIPAWLLGLISVLQWATDLIPFGTFEFWKRREGVDDWLLASWPLFAWGSGVTALGAFLTRNKPEVNRKAEKLLLRGTIASVIAGVSEEVRFRWLGFFLAIAVVQIMNFLFFGFLGFGILEWLYPNILARLANWTTLGYLHGWLFHPAGWFVGAGMIASNGAFRDGHKYLGWIGWVNSWFVGMIFFWLMFQYGILAVMLVHFLYDLFIFIVRYVDAVIERKLGWV